MLDTGEYTKILIPPEKRVLNQKHKSHNPKWLGITVMLIIIGWTTANTFFFIRYGGKVAEYEFRISELETDLETFFKVLAEELDYERKAKGQGANDGRAGEQGQGWTLPLEQMAAKHEKDGEGGDKQQVPLSRRKRQTEFPNIPNSFGPEVSRTEDGVPIVEKSYQISANTNARTISRGNLRRFDGIVVPTTPESEGLRLYEGLVETGGRNEPKSSNFEDTRGQEVLLPHHRVSAAWSEKDEIASRAQSGSGIQLKSLGESDLGIFDDRYGGPRYANSMVYAKSGESRGSRRSYPPPYLPLTRPTRTYAPYPAMSSSVVMRGEGIPAGGTYHRNSRVAATAGADNYFGAPVSNSVHGGGGRRRIYTGRRDRPQTREEYAPLRKLSLGEGQGEVIARVIQDEDDRYPHQRQRYPQQSQGQRKLGNYQGGQGGQQQYLGRRPTETRRRPVPIPTENPAGYTEARGSLNVTISKSTPFRTYYNSRGGSWGDSQSNYGYNPYHRSAY